MDSIKIIKKHGQPGGMPVVTVYVDEDAPGEVDTLKMYQHNILIPPWAGLTVVTKDATPFTISTFAKWLYDNGFRNTTEHALAAYNFNEVKSSSTPDNKFVVARMRQIFSTQGSTIYLDEEDYTVTLTDGVFSVTTTGRNRTVGSGFFYDNVIEIK